MHMNRIHLLEDEGGREGGRDGGREVGGREDKDSTVMNKKAGE